MKCGWLHTHIQLINNLRHFGVEMCVDNFRDNSQLRMHGNWNCIWKLKVSSKVKNLIRRVCRGCFPTQVRLANRGIMCPNVSSAVKKTRMLCTQCWHVHELCRFGVLCICGTPASQFDNMADTIFSLRQHFQNMQAERFAVILWSIWKRRNYLKL